MFRKIKSNVPLNKEEYDIVRKQLDDGGFGNLVNMLKAYNSQAIKKKAERAKRYFSEKERQKPVEIATKGDEVEEVKMTAKEENKDDMKSLFCRIRNNHYFVDDKITDAYVASADLGEKLDKFEDMVFA